MDEPVDHRGGDDVVAEDLAPAGKRLITRDDHGRALIAGGHQREHQVRGLRIERDIANLVDDQKWDPAERGELVLEPAVALGLGEPGDPFGRGVEADAVTGEAGADPERDRQMCFPVPGGPRATMHSLACRKSNCPRCSITCFFTLRWKVKSNSSSVLRAGN